MKPYFKQEFPSNLSQDFINIENDNLTLILTRIGTFSKQGDEYRTVTV